MEKKILVTGASGFIGSFLVEGALERGQPGRQTRRGRLEILHTGGSQMKRRLRFLDLLVDGFDVAREIIAVQ